MNVNLQTVANKSVKAAGAFAVAAGVVAVSAVVASGAAVGAMVEGFWAAGSAAKSVLTKDERKKQEAAQEGMTVSVEEVQQTEAVQKETMI